MKLLSCHGYHYNLGLQMENQNLACITICRIVFLWYFLISCISAEERPCIQLPTSNHQLSNYTTNKVVIAIRDFRVTSFYVYPYLYQTILLAEYLLLDPNNTSLFTTLRQSGLGTAFVSKQAILDTGVIFTVYLSFDLVQRADLHSR